MSTKIYDAFCVNRPIHAIIPFLNECRAAMEPVVAELAKKAQCARLLRLAQDAHNGMSTEDIEKRAVPYTIHPDRVKAYNYGLFDNPLYWVHTILEMWERHNEFVRSRVDMESMFHLELNMVLFPYEGQTIGITYGASALQEQFLELPEVNDFSFWDCSDGPDDMSEQEWEARGAIWKKILPSGFPNRDGFYYELFSGDNTIYPFITEADAQSFLNEHRNSYVRAIAENSLYQQIKSRFSETTIKEDTVETAFRIRDLVIAAAKEKSAEYTELLDSANRTFPRTWDELCSWFPVPTAIQT